MTIEPAWLEGVKTVAVTAGASAPEILVQDVVLIICRARVLGRSKKLR